MRADPEPHHYSLFQNTNGAPVQIDAHRIDRQGLVDLLEPQRRMRWILCPDRNAAVVCDRTASREAWCDRLCIQPRRLPQVSQACLATLRTTLPNAPRMQAPPKRWRLPHPARLREASPLARAPFREASSFGASYLTGLARHLPSCR